MKMINKFRRKKYLKIYKHIKVIVNIFNDFFFNYKQFLKQIIFNLFSVHEISQNLVNNNHLIMIIIIFLIFRGLRGSWSFGLGFEEFRVSSFRI